ncbi:MAG TPA: 3-oxoacyl-[acyl-carrier-protein] reductase [Rubricoccaceae bacterium]|jgi:3-oxoacyl-[acyl-carrier protein] reductase
MPYTLDLSGTTALVTGGTRGIGRAVVLALAAAGAKVAFTYRASADAADALVAELDAGGTEAFGIQAEAADPAAAEAAVNAVVERWGRIDALVVNAGITRDGLMIRMTAADWQAVIDTNLTGAFHVCKAAYRPMMKQRGGSIVTLSSVVGVTGNAGQANYAASKAGLIGFTKSLAKELAGRGVRANVVAPGYIATDMTAAVSEKAMEGIEAQIPLGRAGTPEDIANAVLWLCSPAAAYVTGHVLHVDGGMAM